MHHIHHTKAFVLKNTPNKEADSIITLYTKDFGLIRAVAAGIRLEKSKLRYSLQNYSLSEVYLVNGKSDFWRITNATLIKNYFSELNSESNLSQKTLIKTFNLILKVITGEERDLEMFEILNSGLEFIELQKEDEDSMELIEILLVLRMINKLGYIGKIEELEKFILNNDEWGEDILNSFKDCVEIATKEINKGLRASNL